MGDKPGFNPLRWDCEQKGCFNKVHRFRIEQLAECLPGDWTAFGDVDATAEIGGRFLFLEFKGPDGDLKTGQRIYFERLTALSSKIMVLVVRADCALSEVYAARLIACGGTGEWRTITLEGLKFVIERWAGHALDAAKWADGR